MSACSCVTYEQIGVGVPMVHALHTAAEFQAECPVHRGCEHRSGAGMCANCASWMFPNLPPAVRVQHEVTVSDAEVAFWVLSAAKAGRPARNQAIIRENVERGKRLGTYDPRGAWP